MSIWSSFAQVEPLRDGEYGADIVDDSSIDLADTGWRGPRGGLLRLCLDEDGRDSRAVLDRRQVIQLRDHLTDWLERTEPT